MINPLRRHARLFRADRRASIAMEYALLAVILAIAAVSLQQEIGQWLNEVLNTVDSPLKR